MEEKRILLIGGNYYPEVTGIGKYNGEMMDWLSKQGYKCTVITTYPYYPYWKVQEPYQKSKYWFKKEIRQVTPVSAPIDIYRCPQYVPKNPSGAKRMVLDLTFFFSAFLMIMKLILFHKRYASVISVVPSFQIGLLAVLYKKLTGAKFLYHIQDLQIDAAKELNMIKSKSLLNTLFKIEKFILKQADLVSSISAGMIENVKEKCHKDIVFFPNWVDTDTYYPIRDKSRLKEEFGFNKSDKIILYSGAIGEKQGLEAILHTAKSLHYYTDVKFVICGSGPYKEKLEELKASLELQNVIFVSLQPAHKLNRFLNMADIHLVIQKANASDLVMPSKLTNILSIGGLSVVTAPEKSSLHTIISENNMGILAEPGNQSDLKNAIEAAIMNNNALLNTNARSYAEQFLSIDKILESYTRYMRNQSGVQQVKDQKIEHSIELHTDIA